MKRVFTDISQIAHLWANQLQDEARNTGNFYFNGDTIYSYGSHFPIARHVKNKKGEAAVLFTERGYSSTTSGHISVVRNAVNHKNVIHVSDLSEHSVNPKVNNVWKIWQDRIENIAQSMFMRNSLDLRYLKL